MKKQKTTKKGISKAKVTKKAESKLKKKELIKALSGKPSKQKKKTPAKKAAKTKKAVAPKKAIKKTTPKKIKAVPKKPEKKVKIEKAKPATAKKKTAKKSVAKTAPKKPIKKAAVKKAVAKKAVKKTVAAKKTVKTLKKPPEALEKLIEVIEIPAEMPLLPVGYGENKLASMPVTPRQVYAYWEITEDTISRYQGSLNLKVINTKTNAFFYTPISERIGEQFISVSPASEYTVEIGVINYKGEFVRILKSLPVEVPVTGMEPVEVSGAVTDEAGILPEEFFEIPESISSY